MLLAGFNGLFTKLESEVDTLLAAVQHVDSHVEDGVEVYKEVQELSVCTSFLSVSSVIPPKQHRTLALEAIILIR